jgi:hypothetical protein
VENPPGNGTHWRGVRNLTADRVHPSGSQSPASGFSHNLSV